MVSMPISFVRSNCHSATHFHSRCLHLKSNKTVYIVHIVYILIFRGLVKFEKKIFLKIDRELGNGTVRFSKGAKCINNIEKNSAS